VNTDRPAAATGSRHGGRRRRSVEKDSDEVDRSENIADMIRLLAAPILASEVKTALVHSKDHPGSGKSLSTSAEAAAVDVHSNQSHFHGHYHHHHHQQQQQQQSDRGPWQRTAEIMARPPVVKITSYEMSRAAGRLPVVPESRDPRLLTSDLCPRCSHPRRLNDTAAAVTGETQLLTLRAFPNIKR